MIQDFTDEELTSLDAKDVLIFINNWARANKQERHKGHSKTWPLWAILTALRGPDRGNEDIKHETTVPIRECLRHLVGSYATVLKRDERFRAPDERYTDALYDEDHHFAGHIRGAFYALNVLGFGPNGWEDQL